MLPAALQPFGLAHELPHVVCPLAVVTHKMPSTLSLNICNLGMNKGHASVGCDLAH